MRAVVTRTTRAIAKAAKGRSSGGYLVDELMYQLRRAVGFGLGDRMFIRIHFFLRLGSFPNLHHPRSFSEKLQWMKLYFRHPSLPSLADKYLVRAFVAQRIGTEYLTPIYGVYDSVEDLDAAGLPSSFVLKPTHGSGWIVLCRDRSTLDWPRTKRDLRRWMRRNFYYYSREWPYKHLIPRIVCEELLQDGEGNIPLDYKFFCFDGQPLYVQVDLDRFGWHHRHIYDTDWQKLSMELEYPGSPETIPAPVTLGLMLRLAGDLSAGMPFCRVDFYAWNHDVRFGELTFYPGSGTEQFRPPHRDLTFGEHLNLPSPVR